MSRLIRLGPLFNKDLHPQNWRRPSRPAPGFADYRVTNPFDGKDLINGGIHGAVDVGDGQGRPDPVLAPISCQVRGLFNFDGARGVEFDLGDGYRVQCWHLSATLEVAMTPGRSAQGPWKRVTEGQVVGQTGNTGVVGLPVHTHVELWAESVRRDIEPHLPMPERPARPIVVGEDMELPASRTAYATASAPINTRVREAPAADAPFYQLKAPTTFDVLLPNVIGGKYTLDGGKTWRTDWTLVARNEAGYIARGLLQFTPTAEGSALEPGGAPDPAQLDAAFVKGRDAAVAAGAKVTP